MNTKLPHTQENVWDQALQWQVILNSGECTVQENADFAHWLAEHPAHAETWGKLNKNLHRLAAIPAALKRNVHQLADTEVNRRRQWLKSIGAAFLTGSSAFALIKTPQSKIHLAQHQTAKGEVRVLELPDGSTLTLNSASAADIHFTPELREVILHAGEIQLSSAQKGAPNKSPMQVRVREGVVRAIGTRFTVKRHSHYGLGQVDVAVQEGMVDVSTAHEATKRLRLKAGQAVQFDTRQLGTPATAQAAQHAWTKGLLIAERQLLCDFLAELQHHRPGILRCDPAVATLQLSGVFPLNNTDYVLETIANTLPVQIRQVTPYWTVVEHRPPDQKR